MREMRIAASLRHLLVKYAAQYETREFLADDPSRFMHEVSGERNREAVAFVASSLSYGSRRQFMPKIARILEWADGDVDRWIRSGRFQKAFPADSLSPFYRFYRVGHMHSFLAAYREILLCHGSLGEAVAKSAGGNALGAIKEICRLSNGCGFSSPVVPASPQSACKRIAMFLRWMVRDSSPVDLGLWADFIAKDSLIMPLDVHVLAESKRLGLMDSSSASMAAALSLTETMRQIFPGDPLKGDFALFGYGVNKLEDDGRSAHGDAPRSQPSLLCRNPASLV